MPKYTWILTPDLTNILVDKIYEYSCYDERCLISTYFKDDILDFLENKQCKVYSIRLNEQYCYQVGLDIDEEKFYDILDSLIDYKTGRFVTTSIYILENDNWVKVWKKGKFYFKK